MSQKDEKRVGDRVKQSNDLHKLKRAKEKWAKYLQWLDGTLFLSLTDEHRTIFCRAFKTFEEGTDDEKFSSFWAWAGTALADQEEKDRAQPDYPVDPTARSDCKRTWSLIWRDLTPLTTSQYFHVGKIARDLLAENETYVDPVINDMFMETLWKRVVPEEVQEEVEFRNTSGDGWIYEPFIALWKPVDVKQMQVHLLRTMNTYLSKTKIVVFTTEKQQTYWTKIIGDAHTFTGLLNILKGKRRYPNPKEEQFDKREWLIPCGYFNTFDAKNGTYRARNKDDYFTQEAGFSYLAEKVADDDVIINDNKLRERFYEELEGEQNPDKIVKLLDALCPNAMKLVRATFANDDRLWFMLVRLGALLSGFCTREVLFVWGKGKGGKSTLMQTIVEVCGDLGVVLSKSSFTKTKLETGSSHKTDLKRASSKRVCLVDELESSDIMNETLVKNWASHQKIPMREIYGRQGEETLRSYLILITNEPPRFSQEDPTIRERVRGVKGTTKYFDKDCPPNQTPLSYDEKVPWVDKYVSEEDTYWCYRTPEKEEFARSFRTNPCRKNELGTLLCLLTSLLYKISKGGKTNQLPYPKIVQNDTMQFFQESDVVATFLDEYYQDEKDYTAACSLKEVYEKFRTTFPELGIKNFTLQTFKRSLAGKSLIFSTNHHKTIKIKKSLKQNTNSVYYPD